MKVFRENRYGGVLILYGPNSYIFKWPSHTARGDDYTYEHLWYGRASPLWQFYTKVSIKNYYETL